MHRNLPQWARQSARTIPSCFSGLSDSWWMQQSTKVSALPSLLYLWHSSEQRITYMLDKMAPACRATSKVASRFTLVRCNCSRCRPICPSVAFPICSVSIARLQTKVHSAQKQKYEIPFVNWDDSSILISSFDLRLRFPQQSIWIWNQALKIVTGRTCRIRGLIK